MVLGTTGTDKGIQLGSNSNSEVIIIENDSEMHGVYSLNSSYIDVFTVQVKFERGLVKIPERDFITVGVVAMGDLSENLTVTVLDPIA